MDFHADFTMTVDGAAVAGAGTLEVVNPATGETFARAPDASQEQLDQAVTAARDAFDGWRRTPLATRQALLRKAGDTLLAHVEDLAVLFTREQGRPVDAARNEIRLAAAHYHAHAGMEPPVQITEDSEVRRTEVHYEPLGVVCAIAPWNFPMMLSTWKIAPALLAGNTLVLKPSPFTPLCTLKVGELLRDVFPPGVLNVITGGDDLGPWMTAHPGFDKVSFTGSTETGKKVMASCAQDLKRVTLELGGNDAAIVLPDVDVPAIAQQVFFGAFFNTAQICVATKRLYVHDDVYDELRDHLHGIARQIKVGDGSEQGTVLGPIQNARQYERVVDLLEDARASGLTLLTGAEVPENGYFVPITLVDDPPPDSRVVTEEAFGPILPMLRFDDEDTMIAQVNDTEYGLAGSVWSEDVDRAVRIAHRMETGTVWINENLYLPPSTPFGGHKKSGIGVENGIDGLLGFMVPKAIHIPKKSSN
ncbi:MAG: aldehyde dehydrogenase family protein [Pseudomonadota bacterium]